ncbi:type VI secretion system protein TssA [Burkholderia stagnalis]|uniref:type VI secretion system protein TssA n=1 Tax=Burkholderia stagnalis TaxID=1503054 RepID=UPI000F55F516|nr:type VI secretion system protein TssA [Burkholderia stagnalis]RQQ06423.1 type VI secretion system protein TssA [Burkholderia stagnalis]RQQ14381.1 type VI secretion system protein TssA [Burkholderia stagnalis]RQQ29793.1 type VI secretion system protein TssA [Burkholderia stagnalis]RQQ33400.1 type VI secretion system protein TssA [Burkholderia stagnalis]RQQ34627.1 type VI secretion system protein TssA [Burkholderia stagnalis]
MRSNDLGAPAPAAAASTTEARADLIDRLLDGVAPDAPCGANLEYEPDFLQLREHATPRPEQQYGDTVIPAEAPDWRAVERLALALSGRTKDLRVAAYLTRSWTELHGIPGYADGLAVVAGLLGRWWDDVHPRLDADGEPDPTPRCNALAEVAGAHDCARAARRQPLFDGGPSVRDAERMLDGHDDGGERQPGDRERLLDALLDVRGDGPPPLQPARAALAALASIRAQVSEKLGGEWAPDASDVEKALHRIVQRAPPPRDTAAPAETGADGAAPGQAEPSPRAAPADGRAWRDAEVTSRDDVRIGLDKICRYFELHEPSHPAPLLLRRAQRLLALDFYEIIRDLAPESLPKLDLLSGQRSE